MSLAEQSGDAATATATDTVVIYTDGACHGNPGPGGWGAVLRFGEHEKQILGGDRHTTNNRMELTAAIEALAILTVPGSQVQLWTDSQYVRNGITSWIAGWKRKGWKTSTGQPVKNDDLWRRLDQLASQFAVDWRWVKGHAGHEGNELADRLATRGAIEHGGSSGAVGALKQGGGRRGGNPRNRSSQRGGRIRSGGEGNGRW